MWGTTSVDGGGERDRYAAIAELRLPIFEPLTVSLSGRYDRFEPDAAETVDKTTYSLGVEYRPVESFLIRGKYGTAFKAPTLADQFQAESGYYSTVTDYYRCQLLGFDPTEVDQCPAAFSNRQYFGTTEGSRDLEPLSADVWNVGFVGAPLPTLSFTADYFRWDIEDEVGSQDPDGLALREMYCRTGANGYDINSPVCVDVLTKITRDSLNRIVEIYTPKVNEAQQILEAVNVSANYVWDAGSYGEFLFRGSYTNNLTHEFTAFEGDEPIDLLRNPGWSSDPKTKANVSVTWRKNDWSTTLYANHIGHTPNNRARVLENLRRSDRRRSQTEAVHDVQPQLQLCTFGEAGPVVVGEQSAERHAAGRPHLSRDIGSAVQQQSVQCLRSRGLSRSALQVWFQVDRQSVNCLNRNPAHEAGFLFVFTALPYPTGCGIKRPPRRSSSAGLTDIPGRGTCARPCWPPAWPFRCLACRCRPPLPTRPGAGRPSTAIPASPSPSWKSPVPPTVR
ncbi:TonB-dependent receptor domain-containing protein [Pseudoxanthomonas mexicana]